MRGLAYRVTGKAERDRDRAAEIQASIGNIEQRKAEQHQALNAEQQADRAALAGRYIGRAAQLEQRIQRQGGSARRKAGYPPEAREATTGQEIGREAENSPVEGREVGTGETAPREPEATHAPPEQAQEAEKPGRGRRSRRNSHGREAEREARIDAERERQEARDREHGSNDNDRGREIE